jgi:polyhydroxybutyrate depolymerase
MKPTLACLLFALGCGTAAETTDGPPPESSADAGAPDAPMGDGATPAAGNVPGTYRHTLTVDGLPREVLVYVPASAAGTEPVPVVLMLHGTTGTGEEFYRRSLWREKADVEGLIAVFPTAMTHCYFEDETHDGVFADPGERKVTTKWAAGKLGDPTVMPLCSAAELAALSPQQRRLADHPLADDLAYIGAVLDLLGDTYVIETERVYASGFSNGAGMTSRLAQRMSDRFAAIHAGSGFLEPDPGPAVRPLPVLVTLGSQDSFIGELGVAEPTLDATLFDQLPAVRDKVTPMLDVLGLADPFTYSETEVAGKKIISFVWTSATASVDFRMIEDQTHQYPNGTNHPVVVVDLVWEFFRPHSL